MQLTLLAPVAVLALLAPGALARASGAGTELYARDAYFDDADDALLDAREAGPELAEADGALQHLLARNLEVAVDLHQALAKRGEAMSKVKQVKGKCIHKWVDTYGGGKRCSKCGKLK